MYVPFEKIQTLYEHVKCHSALSKVVEVEKGSIPQQGIKRKSAPMQGHVFKRRGKKSQSDINEKTTLKINHW